MKDHECKEYLHTYKCNKKSCDGCENRYVKNKIITDLKNCAKEENQPIQSHDKTMDHYMRLSKVIEIINKYVID